MKSNSAELEWLVSPKRKEVFMWKYWWSLSQSWSTDVAAFGWISYTSETLPDNIKAGIAMARLKGIDGSVWVGYE